MVNGKVKWNLAVGFFSTPVPALDHVPHLTQAEEPKRLLIFLDTVNGGRALSLVTVKDFRS